MAKLYFNKNNGVATRASFLGILGDNESSVNDNFYTTVDISTSDYNNFVSYTKDFTVGENNTITWIDTGAAQDQNGDDMSQTEAMYQQAINDIKNALNTYKDLAWNSSKLTQINSYLSELDAIDTSTISFPFSGNMEKDIASKCSNSIHPQNLNVDTTF